MKAPMLDPSKNPQMMGEQPEQQEEQQPPQE